MAGKEKSSDDAPKFNLQDLPEPPVYSASESSEPAAPVVTHSERPAKGGFFSRLFKKKEVNEKLFSEISKPLEPLPSEEEPSLKVQGEDEFAPSKFEGNVEPEKDVLEPDAMPLQPQEDALDPVRQEEANLSEESTLPEGPSPVAMDEPDWYQEGEHAEVEFEARESEMLGEGENYLKEKTPLSEVKGVGPVREKKLKKAGVKSAEHLAMHKYKELAKKAKIPEYQAKEIISNARKIADIKERLKASKIEKKMSVSNIIKQLQEEKKTILEMQKISNVNEDKIIELEGHKDLIAVLGKLEKKRLELAAEEEKLAQKEIKVTNNDETHTREMEQVENLRRKLDHEVRERTQYLINLEKEYFQKAQVLAKKQSDVEIKERQIIDKEKYFKEKEVDIKRGANEVEDRTINLEVKEKKFDKIMKDLERHDIVLKEKEENLMKREDEYLSKLNMLERHEKTTLRDIEERRRNLEYREREIQTRERRILTKENVVNKKNITLEYAQNVMQQQKNKLVDEEFDHYLHEQLSNTGINVDDINFTNSVPLNTIDRSKNIYQLIDTCKDLLKNNRVTEAKVFYNQIREKFYNAKIETRERDAIHNIIRTLYDDINLADIGTNR